MSLQRIKVLTASAVILARLAVFAPVYSQEPEAQTERPLSAAEARARALERANARLQVHAELLRDIAGSKASTRVQELFDLLREGLHKASPDRQLLQGLLNRLVVFNDRQCLDFLIEVSRDQDMPQMARQWAGCTLKYLKTNWAEDVLEEWRGSEAAQLLSKRPQQTQKTPEQLAAEFAEKVAEAPPFEFDLSKRLSNEEVVQAIKAGKVTSFYREIQELIRLEVREAKPTVLKLLNTSKNPDARQYALEYLGNLFREDSLDIFADCLADDSNSVKHEAIKWLSAIGSDKAAAALSRRLKIEGLSEIERQEIIKGLGQIDGEKAAEALIEYSNRIRDNGELLGDRINITIILAEWNRPEVVEHLIKEAEDRWRGRAVAFWALAGIENEKTTQFLQSQRENEDVRIKAVSAASAASHGDKDAIKELISAWKSDPYPRPGSNIYQWLPSYDREQLLRLMCRMKGMAIPFVIDTLNDQRMGGTWPEEFRRECQDILNARAEEISRELADYIKALSKDKWFTPSWAMAVEAYCLVEKPAEEMLPALRNAYARFEEQSLETINRYGQLRKMLALKLETVDGKRYLYTYFEALGRQ